MERSYPHEPHTLEEVVCWLVYGAADQACQQTTAPFMAFLALVAALHSQLVGVFYEIRVTGR